MKEDRKEELELTSHHRLSIALVLQPFLPPTLCCILGNTPLSSLLSSPSKLCFLGLDAALTVLASFAFSVAPARATFWNVCPIGEEGPPPTDRPSWDPGETERPAGGRLGIKLSRKEEGEGEELRELDEEGRRD